MTEYVYQDVFGDEIVLTSEIRDTILLLKHPEVVDFIDRLNLVLQQPDQIRRSVWDERVVLYSMNKYWAENGWLWL